MSEKDAQASIPVSRRYPSKSIVNSTASQLASISPEEEYANSADGTRIGFRRLGKGPAIVFVHGSVSTHTDWMPAAKLLSSRFTCYVMDRRGRRGSGSGHGPYSIKREYEDICAVLDLAGPGSFLAGHSFGAVCALGAALRHPVPKLVLYEPPLPLEGPIAGPPLVDYARAVEANDFEGAMEFGLKKFTRLRPEVIAAIHDSRGWPRLCRLAPTWTRELLAMDAMPTTVEPFRAIDCPVLFLLGTLSTEHPMQNTTRALAAALPDARIASLEGQDHLGLRGAPDQVARHIAAFLAPAAPALELHRS